MIRFGWLALAALILAAPSARTQAQVQAKQTTYALIRCESPRGRDSYCPADTRLGVQLTRDLNGRCQIGRTWGYDRGGIWVRGCSGEFEIGRRGNGYGWGWGYQGTDYVVCESRDYRYELCNVNTRGGVVLTNQISRADCVEGRSWGYDNRGIWVDQGCAGEFAVGGRPGGGGRPQGGGGDYYPADPNLGATFTCESRDNRRRQCAVSFGRGNRVTVIRNISSQPCVEGDTWGYDGAGVWVDRGCRAEFRVIQGSGGNYPGPGPGGGGSAETVRCESRDYKRTFCDVGRVQDVRLRRQISKSQCVEGQTWGYDRRRLWVDQGCGAEFDIYR